MRIGTLRNTARRKSSDMRPNIPTERLPNLLDSEPGGDGRRPDGDHDRAARGWLSRSRRTGRAQDRMTFTAPLAASFAVLAWVDVAVTRRLKEEPIAAVPFTVITARMCLVP